MVYKFDTFNEFRTLTDVDLEFDSHTNKDVDLHLERHFKVSSFLAVFNLHIKLHTS